MARVAATAFAGASCVGLVVACRGILGIEELPLRGADAGDAGPSVDASDASTCRPEQKGCSADCPRDFCDDFDLDGQAPSTRWVAPAGFVNPVARGDASLELVPVAFSTPMSLAVTSGSPNRTSYSILVHQLDFRKDRPASAKLAGLLVSSSVRFESLSYVPDAGFPTDVAVLGLLRPDSFPPKGIAIVVQRGGASLDVSEDVLGGSAPTARAELGTGFNVEGVLGAWVTGEIFVGTKARAVARGFAKCNSVPDGMVAAAALGKKVFGEACTTLPASLAGDWVERAVLLTGAAMFAPGYVKLNDDDVTAVYDAE
jgi:hypothetical protein